MGPSSDGVVVSIARNHHRSEGFDRAEQLCRSHTGRTDLEQMLDRVLFAGVATNAVWFSAITERVLGAEK